MLSEGGNINNQTALAVTQLPDYQQRERQVGTRPLNSGLTMTHLLRACK